MKFSTLFLVFSLPCTSLFGQIKWKGSQTNFNGSSSSWSKGGGFTTPGLGVDAIFDSTPSKQPTVTSSITTQSLDLQGASQITLTATAGTLSLQTGLTVAPGSSLDFTGTLSKAGSGSLDLDIDGSASFSGTINNSGNNSVNLTGSGETTLLNTTVGSSLNIGADSTLKGSGVVSGSLSLIGTLSPGETGAGAINVGGSMSGSGTWVFDAVDSSTRDVVAVGGSLVVSGFDLVLSGPRSTANGPIVIATYGGSLGGKFAKVEGLLPGQSISYDNNQIAITGAIIPEVTHIIPLSLAFLPLVAMRKRRSRR